MMLAKLCTHGLPSACSSLPNWFDSMSNHFVKPVFSSNKDVFLSQTRRMGYAERELHSDMLEMT
jgi:hypothetical protein